MSIKSKINPKDAFIKIRSFVSLKTSFSDTTESFHPASYYMRGGVDITGQALACDADVKYDTEEELSSDGIEAAALCNPRVGFLDLVERLGAEEAEATIAEALAKQQTEQKTTE